MQDVIRAGIEKKLASSTESIIPVGKRIESKIHKDKSGDVVEFEVMKDCMYIYLLLDIIYLHIYRD